MKKLFRALLMSTTALLLPLTAIAADYQQGEQFEATSKRMAKNPSDNIVVMEMFSYSCPHCFRLDPITAEWKETLPENVTYMKVPAIFRDSWLQLARVYYAAEVTGDSDTLHSAIFHAIHADQSSPIYRATRPSPTEEELLDFVAAQGIDRDAFEKTMSSFTVQRKVKEALLISQTSGISGVPAIIVNNQYHTDAPKAGSMEEMLEVVEYLIEKTDAK